MAAYGALQPNPGAQLTLMNSPSHATRLPSASSEKWEKFAQEDPYTYILTTLKSADTSEFWKRGERTMQEEILPASPGTWRASLGSVSN